MDGYTLKSQSTFLQGKDRVGVSKGTKNLVSNFVKNRRDKKEQEKNKKEDIEAIKEEDEEIPSL
jgi:hypothetical protein